jgi:hypothetical protein
MYKRPTLLTLALACLSGCRQIEKITGAPHRLNNAEAAARYLDIICPTNFELEKLDQNSAKKLKQYKGGILTDVEWGKDVDSKLLKSASINVRSAQAQTDPDFVWPDSVKTLVADKSAADMESVAAIREFVESGGYTAASKETGPWPDRPDDEAGQRSADKASAIRSALRLPARGEGCMNEKRSLTIEEIKKLQGA